jgi:hypothetical protein
MIGYALVGTNNLPRAVAFFDALLAELGAKRAWETDRGMAWGTAPDQPSFGVIKPYDGKAATVGNGDMVAFVASSREQVDRVHRKALELGGRDEGPAGPRGTSGFYSGYFRDLDGNKLSVFFEG